MANNDGVWLDKDTGKVVNSKPARGRLLASPGKDADNAVLSRYADNYETATESQASVETRTDLNDMTKDELFAEADRRGVEVKKSATKAELLEALGA